MKLTVKLTINLGKDADTEQSSTDPGDATTYPVTVGFDAGRYGRIEETI